MFVVKVLISFNVVVYEFRMDGFRVVSLFTCQSIYSGYSFLRKARLFRVLFVIIAYVIAVINHTVIASCKSVGSWLYSN